MAKVAKGEVAAILDGEPILLALDFNALCEIEDQFGGESFAAVLVEIDAAAQAGRPRLSDIRKLFLAVLRARLPQATAEQAGRLTGGNGEGPLDLFAALVEASEFFDREGGEEGLENPPKGRKGR